MSDDWQDAEPQDSDLAIVGIACRFPGADDPESLWSLFRDGREAIRRYSDDELIAAGVDPATLRDPAYVKAGGELSDIAGFDAGFFGLGPKDAAITDPQHRHFMECAWAALEDAACVPQRFEGSIGVFAGCGMNAYFIYNLLTNREILESTGTFLLRHTGNDRDFLPTTVSYKLDLTGPSVAIQTACSTSLVAIHMAGQSLLSGECDMALAGGSTIIVPTGRGYRYSENEPLSPDGHCRAFDARGAGTVLTSGVGVVAIRRLADALEDGDPVRAVIRGSAINNDGSRKIGYLAPSVDGQAAVVAEALAVAGLGGDDISYVATHGTGTNVGDPIELSALTRAFRESTQRTGYCAIGSSKPNIGHTDTAAGVASVIEVVKALEHRQLPPSLNYERPNPNIDFDDSPFFVNDRLRDWDAGGRPRRAGVSSLGVGGTNAHVILEEPPAPREIAPAARSWQLLPLSAKSASALESAADQLARWLRENPGAELADVAWTLQSGRAAFEHRRVVAARSAGDAIAALEASESAQRAPNRPPSVVFMFPGGGSQYPDMGRGLYASEPVYRAAIDECLELVQPELDFDLRSLMFPGPDPGDDVRHRLSLPSACLPAIFATSWALARQWMAWGIEPTALTGHSLGEYTAACLAGVMSLRDALRMVALRGRLVDSIDTPGRMLSVPLPEAEVRELIGDRMDLASSNGPSLCVVSGTVEQVEALDARLRERDVECRQLRVPAAGHSRILDPILDAFREGVSRIELREPECPYVSNLTGTWIVPSDATDPGYWVRHLREPVLFNEGLSTLLAGEERVLLEVGPGQTLSSLARQQSPRPRASVASLRHPEEDVDDEIYVAGALGRIWSAGVELDWARLHGETRRRRLHLPTYPFEHRPYWIEPGSVGGAAIQEAPLERVDDVQRWFWEPVWEREELSTAVSPARWLIFVDAAGVASRLIEHLERAGHEVITVREGDAFYRLDEREFALSPEAGADGYAELVRALQADDLLPDRIAHLWLVTADESARAGSSFFHRNEERGFYSLLHLAQALGAEDVTRPLHIAVVSSGMQRVGPEPLHHPDKSTVLGPLQVIPMEFPGVTCQGIDLPGPDPAGEPDLAARLVADIHPQRADAQIAYRGGQRLVQRFARSDVAAGEPSLGPVREGGTYLVTGGLGGLGLVLASHLARTPGIRLALLSRTPLPARESWQAWIDSHGSTDPTAEKLRILLEIEALGATAEVHAADVADIARMREVIEEVRSRLGHIDGVFHVAGAIDDGPIQSRSEASIDEVMAPKVHGTLVLDEVLRDAPPDFVVLFSSSSSLLGPAGQVDYVAASAFLNAFAQSRRDDATRWIALDWGVWRDAGLAVETYERLSRTGGRPAAHPLLGRIVEESPDRVVFERTFTVDDWILDEHRTGAGVAILPGTGFLALARAAGSEASGWSEVEIRSASFVAPLDVPEGTGIEVRLTLTPDDKGWDFEIESSVPSAAEWQLHATGSVARCDADRPAPLDVAGRTAACSRETLERSDNEPIETSQARHLRFGPRWSSVRGIRLGDDEAIARLQLPPAFVADLDRFPLHPALLDMATGFALPLVPGYEPGRLYAPLSYGRVRAWAPLQERIYAWARSAPGNDADAEVAIFDVTIVDEDGEVLVDVEQFAVRRLPDQQAFAPARSIAAASGSVHAGEGALSAAERVFQATYELGIGPVEGMQALDRVLASAPRSQLVISSIELEPLIERFRGAVPETRGGGESFARPELESDFVAARDEVERRLGELWTELLGVDPIGIHDDFFELGGHSLIAARLFAKIKKAWSIEFGLSVLFEAPTIAGLAELLRSELGLTLGADQPTSAVERPRLRFVVPLQRSESGRPPFFLVAGMFGNVLNLRHLALHLGADQPVYALQAKGLLGDDEPHRRFEDAARDYLQEVRSVQPEGPYFLGGFSGGGLTALEMAVQLRDEGDEVGLLVLLDSIPAEPVPLGFRQKLGVHLQKLQRQGAGYLLDWARSQIRWRMEQLRARRGASPRDLSPAEFRSEQIEAAFREALESYRTPVYPGPAVLIRPPHDHHYDLGGGLLLNPADRQVVSHDNRFGPHIAGGLEVCVVTGDHDSMVLEPHVRGLGARLRGYLDQAMGDKPEGAPS